MDSIPIWENGLFHYYYFIYFYYYLALEIRQSTVVSSATQYIISRKLQSLIDIRSYAVHIECV